MQKAKRTFTISARPSTLETLRQLKLRIFKERQEVLSNNKIIELLLSLYKENEEYRKKVDECIVSGVDTKDDTHGLAVSAEVKYELMSLALEKKSTMVKVVDCLVRSYA